MAVLHYYQVISGIVGDVVAQWLARRTWDLKVESSVHPCCVLRQNTLLSQCLSPPRCMNGDHLTKCWEVPCDGLVSHPGGVEILLVALYYRNRR